MTERRFKLVVLGTTGVGKTCLTLRFVKGLFDDEQLPTIGAAYMTKKVTSNSKQYIFEIWDTAGQERYEAITPLYYRSAEAAVIVFDLTSQQSFVKAKEWLKRLRRERPDPKMPIALAGNKSDVTPRQVNEEEIAAFVQENSLKYFESSAKTGANVDEMFTWTADNLPEAEAQSNEQVVFPVSQEDLGESNSQCC
mmetsp:Transcript_16230/g.18380  ORF Transcript_16230/g.18380 Transcript_16230/m.18380 type:complete len:195 (-) Transcript_16230:99-683(-)|eukprot:CAMPEP_0184009758 /NCGR_PEP_ID=MMETSP0954-20121128/2800_1 /TAXON_ID=627963 /ORGANISM="Aplanochytrium sp, Strain PBS07" /LENGTH=194 /DNA_ID=CAMNT_0026289201 /DNA_START=435 /DNA_END=1019 /DNA_ORIENTATION=-